MSTGSWICLGRRLRCSSASTRSGSWPMRSTSSSTAGEGLRFAAPMKTGPRGAGCCLCGSQERKPTDRTRSRAVRCRTGSKGYPKLHLLSCLLSSLDFVYRCIAHYHDLGGINSGLPPSLHSADAFQAAAGCRQADFCHRVSQIPRRYPGCAAKLQDSGCDVTSVRLGIFFNGPRQRPPGLRQNTCDALAVNQQFDLDIVPRSVPISRRSCPRSDSERIPGGFTPDFVTSTDDVFSQGGPCFANVWECEPWPFPTR